MVTTGSSLGGVIFPIMTSRLINIIGFGWSMRISAFLILFLLIIANLTIRPFPQEVESVRLNRFHAPEILKILRNDIPFVILTIGLLVYAFGYFVPINYIAAEATAKGVDPNLIQYLIPILNAARYEEKSTGCITFILLILLYLAYLVVCSLGSQLGRWGRT